MTSGEHSLLLVVDTSGSMMEMGKSMLACNLASFVAERFRMGYLPSFAPSLQIVQWNDEIRPIEIGKSFRRSWPEPRGGTIMSNLQRHIEDSLGEENSERWVLMLTDGAFPDSDLAEFASWIEARDYLKLRVVAIGPDADMQKLGRLSDRKPFLPEEIGVALDSFFSTGDPEASPIDLTDILITP